MITIVTMSMLSQKMKNLVNSMTNSLNYIEYAWEKNLFLSNVIYVPTELNEADSLSRTATSDTSSDDSLDNLPLVWEWENSKYGFEGLRIFRSGEPESLERGTLSIRLVSPGLLSPID